ncbi:MAG TPA: beta galactosidase jelly roll domain-containing protein [Cyclobacteriaceae bacterium]|nr:beta galactosidase jelly roll domain-containing protein [Cyclobacteriaceae bacterium]
MKYLFLFIAASLLKFTPGIAQEVNLKGHWKFHIGDKATWSSTHFDDADWEVIYAPSPWEDEGFNGYDGFAWYRKKFDGHQLEKGENYYLNIGFIDDADEVYLNEKLIGFSGSMPPRFKTAYNSERKYPIPNEAINFDGDNVIAIRVFDVTLGGGIIEGDLGIYRAAKNRMLVDLQGLWDFVPVGDREEKENVEWKKIIVPSSWEHQGYRYDGLAWYKRTFVIDSKIIDRDEDLVLLLGKIDDFDKTYLNGKLIGRTNDGQPFGQSDSYERLRVYPIPLNLLKKKAPNTIEVLVEDMGNIGGIYEGPVGITTRTAYERYFK